VANESYLQNTALEELGYLYREALALESMYPDLVDELRRERADLLASMRYALRRRSVVESILANSREFGIIVVILTVSSVSSGIVSSFRSGEKEYPFFPPPTIFFRHCL
jgi:hypothetical protein